MSEENVDRMRAAWAALLSEDHETFCDFIDPGVVWHQRSDLSTTGYGHAGLRKLIERRRDEWEQYTVEIDELLAAGGHVVAVLGIVGLREQAQS